MTVSLEVSEIVLPPSFANLTFRLNVAPAVSTLDATIMGRWNEKTEVPSLEECFPDWPRLLAAFDDQDAAVKRKDETAARLQKAEAEYPGTVEARAAAEAAYNQAVIDGTDTTALYQKLASARYREEEMQSRLAILRSAAESAKDMHSKARAEFIEDFANEMEANISAAKQFTFEDIEKAVAPLLARLLFEQVRFRKLSAIREEAAKSRRELPRGPAAPSPATENAILPIDGGCPAVVRTAG